MKTVSVVISKSACASPEQAQFEEELGNKLNALGAPLLMIPDICHVSPDDDCIHAISDSSGPIILLTWLYPRAAFWLLSQLGVGGYRSESIKAKVRDGEQRPIVSLSMGDKCCPDKWVETISDLLGNRPSGEDGSLTRFEQESVERWYPVIDYERCKNCLDCLEFCLFGVFDTDDSGRLTVADPECCKPGCPACSRVCPSQAIIFPLHEGDPAIAGSDTDTVKPFNPSVVQQLRSEYSQGKASLKSIIRACACNTRVEPEQGESGHENSSACSDTSDGGNAAGAKSSSQQESKEEAYFDNLIDRLAKE